MLASARRNQLLALGCLAGLLAGASPANAFTSFDVIFDSSIPFTSTESTGVTGKMTFSFTKNSPDPSDNVYTLDLGIFNTSPVGVNPTGTLVGFGLNVPGTSSEPGVKLLSYNPLGSGFGDVFGATNNTKATVGDNSTLVFTPDANIGNPGFEPFKNITFCARDSGNNCVGGKADQTGLADGESTSVRFTLAALSPDLTSSTEVANSFYKLFSTWVPSLATENDTQVALRFQQVNGDGSEKVGGIPKKPPEAPGDTVPGPLPVLGAATAFAFSRKLRRRIASSEPQTDTTV